MDRWVSILPFISQSSCCLAEIRATTAKARVIYTRSDGHGHAVSIKSSLTVAISQWDVIAEKHYEIDLTSTVDITKSPPLLHPFLLSIFLTHTHSLGRRCRCRCSFADAVSAQQLLNQTLFAFGTCIMVSGSFSQSV